MKNLSLSIGSIILLLNISFGLMLSCYQTFNWVLNSIIIAVLIIMQLLTSALTLKDGYKYALLSFPSNISNRDYLRLLLACTYHRQSSNHHHLATFYVTNNYANHYKLFIKKYLTNHCYPIKLALKRQQNTDGGVNPR